MHIYFSGIGGGGIGPLARIVKQAGYTVSGSDKQQSGYTEQLQKDGIDVHIGQTKEHIAQVHARTPIDWFVYSSALPREHPTHPELVFAKQAGIKTSKRDELLNLILTEHHLKLIAIAGTHGKSTTTAMVIWLCQQIGLPISYSVGAKIPFGHMGSYTPDAEYFVYECDEFDRNFLAFHPHLSLVTGIAWDHHEVFPTKEDYSQAFADFLAQSEHAIIWEDEATLLQLNTSARTTILQRNDPHIASLTLPGLETRLDAWLAVQAVHYATDHDITQLLTLMNKFPGLKQRMELLAPGLYTNYAHTPEKIRGGMNAAQEIAAREGKKLIVIYEPLTNRRQHYIKKEYGDSFAGAEKIYWVPTYLAREDPDLPVLTPQELISYLPDPSAAQPAKLDSNLLHAIKVHLTQGGMVVAMGASGAGSLDEWLRAHVKDFNV